MSTPKASLLALMALALPWAASAQPAFSETYPVPASLKRNEVNVRSGPGSQYPILWIYWRAGYPVSVLAQFDNYLKIRDLEGEEGWVHVALISRRHTALVANPGPARLLAKPDTESRAVARLAPGVVVALPEPCGPTLCKVDVVPSGEEGYVRPQELEAPLPVVLQPQS